MLPEHVAALRALAEALPAGTPLSVPREWVLELLAARPDHSAAAPADATAQSVAARYGRRASTIRGWCEAGRFPGAYRLHGREWRIPRAASEAFEAAQRPAGTQARGVQPLSDWRRLP
jgi:helix-turn-helix protein